MTKARQHRGFAAMDPEKLRAISSKAGKASAATGRAHRFKSGRDASAAGRRGGIASGKVRGKKKGGVPGHAVTGDAAGRTGEGQAGGTIAHKPE